MSKENVATAAGEGTRLRRILTFREACEYLGMQKSTLYGYVQAGVIPAFKPKGSRVWKFDVFDIDEWIEAQKQKGGLNE